MATKFFIEFDFRYRAYISTNPSYSTLIVKRLKDKHSFLENDNTLRSDVRMTEMVFSSYEKISYLALVFR